jgi:transcription elongation factor
MMKAGQEGMEVKLDSNKEEIQASKGAMKEEMKTDEEEMKAAVSTILQEKNSWQYETKGCP